MVKHAPEHGSAGCGGKASAGVAVSLPILYSFRRCPYAMRARLALAASRQQCELREVVLRNKPAQLLQASPKGTVPVLVLPGGDVIEESLDIMLWALSDNDPEGWLKPSRGDLQEMLSLISQNDGAFKHHLDRYKYPQRYEVAEPLVHRAAGARWLRDLQARLAHSGQLFGSVPSLADAAIMPFVRQFAQVDRDWFDAQPWPAVHAWLAAWLAAPLFHSVMGKYAPWSDGPGILFPA